MPEVPEWELISFHTASHAVVFFILAVLALRSFSKITSLFLFKQNVGLAALLLSVAFGAIIEWLQTAMHVGRQGDFMDIISNSIGTLLGIVFFYIFRHNKYLKLYF